jgi:hypothetical protein
MTTDPKNQIPSHETGGTLVSFAKWLESLDITRATGWRWRRDGTIKTVNIFGKLYVTREEIARFEQRAMAGEFHRDSPTPSRVSL